VPPAGYTLPSIQSYRPRSFRERGLAAPFTTPMLIGARLRQAGPALEAIVPNPSGGRGVYILPWGNIAALGRPTMHDVVLGRVLSGLLAGEGEGVLSPRLLAKAVEQTALQGLAGRPAAAAAAEAARAAQAGLAATRLALLTRVTTQIEGPNPVGCALSDETPEGFEQRGLAALATLAAELGRPTPALVTAIDQLAAQFAGIGVDTARAEAALPRLVLALGALQHDLTTWAQAESGQSGECPQAETRDALALAGAAELTARMAGKLLEQARAPLADPREALKNFLAAPSHIPPPILAGCDRPVWLLDGWDMICRIWHAAPELLACHHAIRDMARSLPILPDEVESWLGLPPGSAEPLGRISASASSWRDPAPHQDRVARLERLRAVAV
jgi:hypothetical protein